jgi:hypothetical protein
MGSCQYLERCYSLLLLHQQNCRCNYINGAELHPYSNTVPLEMPNPPFNAIPTNPSYDLDTSHQFSEAILTPQKFSDMGQTARFDHPQYLTDQLLAEPSPAPPSSNLSDPSDSMSFNNLEHLNPLPNFEWENPVSPQEDFQNHSASPSAQSQGTFSPQAESLPLAQNSPVFEAHTRNSEAAERSSYSCIYCEGVVFGKKSQLRYLRPLLTPRTDNLLCCKPC